VKDNLGKISHYELRVNYGQSGELYENANRGTYNVKFSHCGYYNIK